MVILLSINPPINLIERNKILMDGYVAVSFVPLLVVQFSRTASQFSDGNYIADSDLLPVRTVYFKHHGHPPPLAAGAILSDDTGTCVDQTLPS